MRVPFVGPSYTALSTNLNAQRTLNWFVEMSPDGKSPIALVPRPGHGAAWVDFSSSSPVRGAITVNDTAYVVVGSSFYEVTADGVATARGTLNGSSGRVGLTASYVEVLILEGTWGYTYNLATATFTQITSANFPGADSGDFLDGLFITVDPSTTQMRCSAVYDGQTWDSLDVASAETSADAIQRAVADHDELVVVGSETTEFHAYNGGSNFPYSKIQGATLGRGTAAKWSVDRCDNSIFWLGDDRVVYRLDGRTPIRISTHAVEFAINGYTTISDAYALTYDWNGHKFYVLTFPSEEATWVYDVATQLWHEAGTFGLGYWGYSCVFRLGGYTVVGSATTGKLYRLSGTAYADDTTAIERVRTGQVLHDGNAWMRHLRLNIDFETGVGLISGQGSAPVAMLSWSDDGGHNYGNEVNLSLGAIGLTTTQATVHRLGRTRGRIYKVRITDPVKTVLIGANLDTAPG